MLGADSARSESGNRISIGGNALFLQCVSIKEVAIVN